MTNDILGLTTDEVEVTGVTVDEATTSAEEKPKKRTRKRGGKTKAEETVTVEETAVPENSGPLPEISDEEKTFDPAETVAIEDKTAEVASEAEEQLTKEETKNYVDIDKPIFIYKTSVSNKPIQQIRGRYYFWDKEEVTGRLPVTEQEAGIGNLAKLAGWINVSDIK